MPLTSSIKTSSPNYRACAGSATRIGVDVNDVNDVSLSLATFGDRYVTRVFNEEEVAYSRAHPRSSASYLAGRFAAREAVVKLLGLDDPAAPWLLASLHGNSDVTVELTGVAHDAAQRSGIDEIFISIDHNDSFAMAVAVADVARCQCGGSR